MTLASRPNINMRATKTHPEKGMDRTDISLCLFLLSNSRTPYHELAARLGLSINAVHKRIGALVNQGVIKAFTAHPSLVSLGAVSVWVYGRSEAAHPSDVHLRLKADDRTYWVANSGGGYVYIGGYLRGIEELDGYVAFAKGEGELGDPTVGIVSATVGVVSAMGGRRPEALRPLDYQILASLRKDSRKPATDVAAEVNASVKTVHRRLEWMTEKGLVDFSIDWYPDASDDIVSLCHVEVDRRFDRMKVLDSLKKRFPDNVLVEMLFSNLPNMLVLFLWTNSMRQMEGLRESLGSVEGAKSAMMNVLQVGYMFDTWRDKMVPKGASPGAS
jgi:DNA-binding Lrp family transcriptional regulator